MAVTGVFERVDSMWRCTACGEVVKKRALHFRQRHYPVVYCECRHHPHFHDEFDLSCALCDCKMFRPNPNGD